MLTAEECRKLAAAYRNQAGLPGVETRTATVLRNIANSFTALASQFEMLIAIEQEQSEPKH